MVQFDLRFEHVRELRKAPLVFLQGWPFSPFLPKQHLVVDDVDGTIGVRLHSRIAL
jgi:hypothetical protein